MTAVEQLSGLDTARNDGPRLEELFAATARSFPQRIAVSADDGQLTYAELDALADEVALRLRAADFAPGGIVGLYADRSTRMLVGLLGILKAGGAYLPIDPAAPDQRVRWLLDDAGASVVVTVPELAAKLCGRLCKMVVVDRYTLGSGTGPVRAPEPGTGLAYVIYTSGSTGTPKGVMVGHSSVARLFETTQPWFAFDEHDVWTMFHSIAFDFSVWEIWGALLHGGRVVVVPYQVSRSPAEMLAILRTHRVTVLNQTPSAFRQLVAADTARTEDHPDLRLVILGGERLDVGMLRPWISRWGDERPRLVNMYGITETTVHASYRRIREADLSAPEVSPIGVPLPDLRFLVLDPNGEPVAGSAPGELNIAGPGLADAYLHRPGLTAERFRNLPAGGGERFFRTGDRVARLDGEGYVYLGRMDDQIKVRGFRVEPREIEVVLDRHPEVGASVVVSHDWGDGDVRLVAYIVPVVGVSSAVAWASTIASDLNRLTTDVLPPHMGPSAYVGLATLPMTANGKVDRGALPAPDVGDKPPRPEDLTITESRIAEVWRTLVGVPVTGPDEDFFDLGGTSLALVRMFSHVNTMFGIDLPLSVLLEGATVGTLAAAVETALAAQSGERGERHA